jgi:cytochrome c peroxidase
MKAPCCVNWSALVLLVGTAAAAACKGSPPSSPDDPGTCQTPAGQEEGWHSSGEPLDGGVSLGRPSNLLPEDGGAMGGATMGTGTMGTGTMGNAGGDGRGVNSGSGTTDSQVTDDTGIALTVFVDQEQQAAVEPDTLTVLLTALPNTNGRFCESCHANNEGWSIRPSSGPLNANARFNGVQPPFARNDSASANDQLDPLFRTNDGTTNPDADVSTPAARTAAYAMLLSKGLIRVGRPIPDGAEFSLSAVDDPYHYASAQELSLFRRPLPMMNLRFLTTLMWDGRLTFACQTLLHDLYRQADDANISHAQAREGLSEQTMQLIVDRERIIYLAQSVDTAAGPLDEDGAFGGPLALSQQTSYYGINAYPGPDPKGAAFDSKAFTLFDAWENLSGTDAKTAARQAIARGQALFNTRTFTIANVPGFNDALGVGSVQGTCTSCHNAPNVGNSSLGLMIDIGVSAGNRRTPDQPLYTLTNHGTGETVEVTDPGRALVTGAWKDIARFKVPTLRGLALRAPYFHDGSAAAVLDVVNFNDARFSIGLTDAEKSDLAAFLNAL